MLHIVVVAIASATERHSAEFQPSAVAATSASTRVKTNAGSRSSSIAFTTTRSGSVKTRNSSVNGPRNDRASFAPAVTMKFTRACESRNSSRIRTAVGSIHELSLVNGSSTTLARWNVVSQSLMSRASAPRGRSDRSGGSLIATACDRSDTDGEYPNQSVVAYRTHVHPIEHLRYVARAQGADASGLVRETAIAIGSLRADPASVVIACRRIVERHPEVGTLWWLSARLLAADDPGSLAWSLADEIENDPTAKLVAEALPAEAVVLTIGWPDIGGAALMRRPDVSVWCADSRHEASSFMQRLERHEIQCEPIPSESLARAAAEADVILVEGLAAADGRALAPVGSHGLAAIGHSLGVPVWLMLGLGRRLPIEYVTEMASRVRVGSQPWDLDVDEIPTGLVSHIGCEDGVVEMSQAALRSDCVYAPELMRVSPF